jgi:hypothetical protein
MARRTRGLVWQSSEVREVALKQDVHGPSPVDKDGALQDTIEASDLEDLSPFKHFKTKFFSSMNFLNLKILQFF